MEKKPKLVNVLGKGIWTILWSKGMAFHHKILGVLLAVFCYAMIKYKFRLLEAVTQQAGYRRPSQADKEILEKIKAIPLADWTWGVEGVRHGYKAVSGGGTPVMITVSDGFLVLPGFDKSSDFLSLPKYCLIIDTEEYTPTGHWLGVSMQLEKIFHTVEQLEGVSRRQPKVSPQVEINPEDDATESEQLRFLQKL